MSDRTCKNYSTDGGDSLVIGGALKIENSGVVSTGFVGAHLQIAAAKATAASTTGIHAAVTSLATPSVVTTGITNPSVPRNITATAGGTAGDIKAIQVVIAGTNYADEAITETLPAFTENTAGSVAGAKAFKTVTSITIPAHDGLGATTAIGFGEVLGLPFKLAHNTHLATYLDNTVEANAPTVTVSATALESNTIDLNSALASKVVDTYFMV